MVRKVTLLYVLYFLLPGLVLGQKLLEVIQPELVSKFQAGYTLPDGTARVFVITSRSNFAANASAYKIDWDPITSVATTDVVAYDTAGYSLIYSATDLLMLPLTGGDCILVSNNFDCDIIPPSQVVYLEADGDIRWEKGRDWDLNYYLEGVESIALADTNVLAFISSQPDTVYFTTAGGEVEYSTSPLLYHHPYYYQDQYFGQRNDSWVRLNEQFEEIAAYNAPGVSFFQHITGDTFLIYSFKGTELVNGNLEPFEVNPSIGPVSSAAFVNNLIYVVTTDGLQVLDIHLNELTLYDIQPAEKVRSVFTWGDSVMVVSDYDGITHEDIVMRTYKYAHPFHIANIDLAIERVQTPDTVYVDFIDGLYYHMRFRFDTISWLVENRGSDTINSFTIKFHWNDWCQVENGEWNFDTILAPGASVVLNEYGYNIETYGHIYPPYCFWVELPDGQPDQAPWNDEACGTSKIGVATEDLFASESISIYPNPTRDEFTIDPGNNFISYSQLRLYTIHGHEVLRQNAYQSTDPISIEKFAPGVYYLQVFNQNKLVGTKSLIILP